MANTSEERLFDPNERVNPFFTKAHIFAFQKPPLPDALKKVNRGGSHDYIPHEYIRALLDRFIGAGRWELQAVLHSTDKEIVKKKEKRGSEFVDVDKVAATAIVNVSLTIFGIDDPSMRLTYKGVGSHTMYAGLDAGYGSVIGNAIDSAESDGVKAAAKNLGKAFGFDLKGKLDRGVLPPNIEHYANQLSEVAVARGMKLAKPLKLASPVERKTDEGTEAGQAEVIAPGAQAAPEPEPKPVRQAQERQAEQAPAPDAAREQTRAQQPTDGGRDSQRQREGAGQTEQGAAAQEPKRDPAPREQAQRTPTAASQQPADPARAEGGAGSDTKQPAPAAKADEPAPWPLDMTPSNYEDWRRLITTLTNRVAATTSEKELANLLRRNSGLIKQLPVFPASPETGDKKVDFPARWRRVIARKYEVLELPIPAEYAPQPVEA